MVVAATYKAVLKKGKDTYEHEFEVVLVSLHIIGPTRLAQYQHSENKHPSRRIREGMAGELECLLNCARRSIQSPAKGHV